MVQNTFYVPYDERNHKNIDSICELYSQLWEEVSSSLSRRYTEIEIVKNPYDFETFFDFLKTLADLRAKLLAGGIAGLPTKVEGNHPHYYNVERLAWDFRRLNILFTFLQKVPLSSGYLTLKGLQDYVRFEFEHDFSFDRGLALAVKAILWDWLADLDLSELYGSFGPGVTSQTGKNLSEKYEYFSDYTASSNLGVKDIHPIPQMQKAYKTLMGEYILACNCSKPTAVPKTYKGPRIIGPEPVFKGWAQHGIMEECYRFLKHHKYLKYRCDLYDQTRNQLIIAYGSYSGAFGTIDLSAASDSVSWELAEFLLSGSALMPAAQITRSTHFIIPGSEIAHPMQKFCGMGSAVCFPIESLIFAATAELARRAVGEKTTFMGLPSWSVYGDDIVITTTAYPTMISYLKRLGFTVNMDKSFNDYFLESCGKEFYHGLDVSPIRFRIKDYASKLVTSETYGSWIALINNLKSADLPETRKYVLRQFYTKRYRIDKKHTKRIVPMYTTDINDTSRIFSTRENQRRYRKCDGQNTWIFEEYGTTVVPEKVQTEYSSMTLQPVYDWLHMRSKQDNSPEQSVQFRAPRGRLVTRWNVAES